MKTPSIALSTKRRGALISALCLALISSFSLLGTAAQTEVTGAFEGKVVNSKTDEPIKDALVKITQKETGISRTRRTNDEGKFFQGMLPPGTYDISISAPGYKTVELTLRLIATRVTKVIPYPTTLEPESAPQ